MKIIHIINIFKTKDKQNVFNKTFQSIKKSLRYHKKYHPNLNIIPIAVFYEEDEDIVPPYFKKASTLKNDAYKELNINSPVYKKVPFIKDIFNNAISLENDYDYLVYTNIDIIIVNDFYFKSLELFNSDNNISSLSITRRTVPEIFIPKTKLKKIVTGRIDKITEKHPGHDTFIIKKGVIEKCNFGNVFIGFPPIGTFILFQMELNGFNFKIIDDKYLTYHLGDDKTWLSKDLLPYLFKNNKEALLCFFDFDFYNIELKKKINKNKNEELID